LLVVVVLVLITQEQLLAVVALEVIDLLCLENLLVVADLLNLY
jgi:hypothetical protein